MKALRLVMVLVGLSLPSCYEFDFPLDPTPEVPQDPRLAGIWRCLGAQPSEDETPATLRIVPGAGFVSRWTFETPSLDETTDKGEFDVHRSSVGGGSLLNAVELGEQDQRKWSFVRYSLLTPDVLRIELMDDEPFAQVKGQADDLRKAIAKRVDDPEIFKDFFVCVRVKRSPEPSSSAARSSR